MMNGRVIQSFIIERGKDRVGARPRRAASLRGELEALRRDSGAGPEAGGENIFD